MVEEVPTVVLAVDGTRDERGDQPTVLRRSDTVEGPALHERRAGDAREPVDDVVTDPGEQLFAIPAALFVGLRWHRSFAADRRQHLAMLRVGGEELGGVAGVHDGQEPHDVVGLQLVERV